MKFLILLKLVVLITIFYSSLSLQSQSKKFMIKSETKMDADTILTRVRDLIREISNTRLKSDNLMSKRKLAGVLPEGYPEEMIKNAKKMRLDKKAWSPLLAFPTEVWRFCLFPYFKINYKKFCNNQYSTGVQDEINACYQSFCHVCCDHLQLELTHIAQEDIIGELLNLRDQNGINVIQQFATENDINRCKKECNEYYTFDMPRTLPTPPRDPSLGKSQENAAASCADILKWGEEKAKSGEYYVGLQKGKQKVYCDMDTENGGWTLFLNYVHFPGAEFTLNENVFPKNLKTNSHMYLLSAGFSERDVKEVRFLCSEKKKSGSIFWHFKTLSDGFIQTALTGDQNNMKKTDLISSYIDLPRPSFFKASYKTAFSKNSVKELNTFGKNKKGGYTHTPFGSSTYNTYWTISGDSLTRFECGSNHEDTGAILSPEDAPNMVFTHHTLWFRGDPPTEDEHRERFLNRADS